MQGASELEVQGRKVKLSNLDKVLFPAVGFTKGQVIDYYINVSRFILPYLKDRPLTLKRYPNGVQAEHFYEKAAPSFTPAWVKRAKIWRVSGKSQINYVVINDLPSLVWSANLANIEMHIFLAKAPKIQQPTALVFDLDPGEPAGVLECAQVALWLRDLVLELGLESFVKASGSKGLHFYIPLNTAVTYEITQPLAQALGRFLQNHQPALVTSEMAKRKRRGKVFIDWSQNSEHKSTVCVYSLRAKKDEPFVSMPLRWEELDRALRTGNPKLFYFKPDEALRRLDEVGDLFAPLLELKQRIPKGAIDRVENFKPPASEPRRGHRSRSPDPSLAAYEAKRDFAKTDEPPPKVEAKPPRDKTRLFVIQKHAARRLHYDFRLEMDGVLKSWAVPKGPPYERNEKRLAMQVEDHPLDYARFEGTIPPGNYGAGTVMVWDIGTYEVMDGNIHAGKLHLRLQGKKLKGEWILVQAARDEKKRSWLLIKGGTSMRRLSQRRDNSSALTGRSLERIAKDNDAQWQSNRPSRSRVPAVQPKDRPAQHPPLRLRSSSI